MTEEFDLLIDALDSDEEGDPEFIRALHRMEEIAETGSTEAAEAVAQVFVFSEKHRDPEKAYFWYHVALAAQGYSTNFLNQNDRLEQYCGCEGDFRNEAQVNGLVAELGESKIRALDLAASEWLRKHGAV